MILYHGAQRWNGSPTIVTHRQGQAEHGPGIYLTTSWETARKYAKGGGAVYRMTVASPRKWLDGTRLTMSDVLAFVKESAGRGRKAAVVRETLNLVAARFGGESVPASVLVNVYVDSGLASGQTGPMLADFLVSQGIDASLVSQGSEDWVVVFNPSLIQRVEKLTPDDVNSPEFVFDLPKITRTAAMATRYKFNVGDFILNNYNNRWVGVVVDRNSRKDSAPLYTLRIVLDKRGNPSDKGVRSQLQTRDEAWLTPFTPVNQNQAALLQFWSNPKNRWADLQEKLLSGELTLSDDRNTSFEGLALKSGSDKMLRSRFIRLAYTRSAVFTAATKDERYNMAFIDAVETANRLKRPVEIRKNGYGGYMTGVFVMDMKTGLPTEAVQGQVVYPGTPLSAEQIRLKRTMAT